MTTGGGPHQSARGHHNAQAQGDNASASVNVTHIHLPTPPPVSASELAEADALLGRLGTDPDGSTPPLAATSRLVHSVNPAFVGRLGELEALAHALKPTGATVAVTGIGGVGKTQLAAEVAHRYGGYFTGGVFWLSFAQHAGVDKEIAECGAVMGFGPQFSELPLSARVKQVQTAWRNPLPRLLIFDGCQDLDLLKRMRPQGGGCRVLVTSYPIAWPLEENLQTVPLGVLNPEESCAMLRKYRPDLAGKDALAAVAEALGHLPLALHLAGSYLRRYRHTAFGQPDAYLKALQDKSLLRHPSLRGVSSEHSPTEHELSVSKTFTLSYRRLSRFRSVDRLACEVLAHAANFAPGEVIPRKLLFATLDLLPHLLHFVRHAKGGVKRVQQADSGLIKELTAKQEDALARLVEVGLVSRDTHGNINLHPLVTAFALSHRDSAAAYDVVKVTLAFEATRVARDKRPADFLYGQTHLRHVTDISIKRNEIGAAYLAFVSSGILGDMAFYHEAEAYLSRALELLEQDRVPPVRSLFSVSGLAFGLSMRQPGYRMGLVTGCLNDLAITLTKLQRYSEAEVTHKRVLKLRLSSTGLRHHETAQSLNNLGDHYAQSGDYSKALTYHKRALAVRKALPNLDPVHLASSYNNLGFVRGKQAHHVEAIGCYDQALEICRVELSAEHAFTAQAIHNKGEALEALGHWNEALTCYEEALRMRVAVLSPHHSLTILSSESRDRMLNRLSSK